MYNVRSLVCVEKCSEESGLTHRRNVLCIAHKISLEYEMDKTALLNAIQTEYAHFESLIAPLSDSTAIRKA
jgi:hypothetical protein